MFNKFKNVYVVDFEFKYDSKSLIPKPICAVIKELLSNTIFRLDKESLKIPFEVSEQDLFVAYNANAELGCMKVLNWPVPKNILDLFVEQKRITNGMQIFNKGNLNNGRSLLNALSFWDVQIPSEYSESYKDQMRGLVLGNETYSKREMSEIIKYCESDVVATSDLLLKMFPHLDLDEALHRGEFCKAEADIQFRGVPIDIDLYMRLLKNKEFLVSHLVSEENKRGNLLTATGSISQKKLKSLTQGKNILWPKTETGFLASDNDTLKSMEAHFPDLSFTRQTRKFILSLNHQILPISENGRNHYNQGSFSSQTGRSQAKTTESVIYRSAFYRHLIVPQSGMAIVEIDYCQQEIGIAAKLSGDKNMMADYLGGNSHLNFAKRAKALSEDSTKESHPEIYDRYKACNLAVGYGMGAESLGLQLGIPKDDAHLLIHCHKNAYPKFWEFRRKFIGASQLIKSARTKNGWSMQVTPKTKTTTLGNFPMQAAGAEILREACVLAYRKGLKIIGTLHDSIFLEDSIEKIPEATRQLQECMAEASKNILDGFEIRTETTIFKHPDRFIPKKKEAAELWSHLMYLLETLPQAETGGVSADEPRLLSSDICNSKKGVTNGK